MNNLGKAALTLFLFGFFATAQDVPQADIALSYSHLQVLKGYTISMNGGGGSAAYNFNNWFGLAADAGVYQGNVGPTLTGDTFTLGPRFTYRRFEHIEPFAQALIGGSHFNISTGGITGGGFPFAWGLGAGLDIPLGSARKFALRLADDDFGTRSGGATTISNRLSAGIAFRFGQK